MTSNDKETPSPTAIVRPDLKELAKHLGVSQTTVSRVLNGSAKQYRISEETQKRVLAAAAKLNYKANVLARSLRSKRSKTVGVMVPEISEGYSTAVLGGIEDVLLLSGFFYFVVSHRHHADLLREYPSLLLSRAVEGIIAVDSVLEEDLPVPVVAVSDHHHRPSVVNIELDHMLAAHYALEHLKRLHHSEIAFIKGQTFSSDTLARWRAICKVAAELDIEVNPRLVTQLDDHGLGTEPGRAATVRLLERGEHFTAIFAFNDLAAIGAITVLRESGIKVPEQVSVVGFDDILSAGTNNPPLTTVRQPLQEMGRVAATTLLQMIQSERQEWPKHPIRVLPAFVERQSTAAARGRGAVQGKNFNSQGN
ncbi:LacI family DNA-binding transcriptional regulator [Alloacidobacterium sp.]|uniref:LacI family DNA-binding transcriptional regulator n=1 Tax=Alloacidobacterium sp. TaxID=2951999 RepID=UPI002D4BB245|nr:LacI family DNA-binding transcriptional regulator [Alloacidobacterium sp.]HYK35699.1 LacI family DNA-binding transcriptional regulator [Alloacidobacterium sp.]